MPPKPSNWQVILRPYNGKVFIINKGTSSHKYEFKSELLSICMVTNVHSSECVVFSLFWEFSLFRTQNIGQTLPSEQFCHKFSLLSLHNKLKMWQSLANYNLRSRNFYFVSSFANRGVCSCVSATNNSVASVQFVVFFFNRWVVNFEIYVVHSPTIALFINLVKSFKFTLQYTIISLLHVSVFNDHHQGALSVPN